MGGRYILGVCAAILSGALFNIGSLIQKLAVMKQNGGGGLIKRLIKTPLWIAGFILQIVAGSPLNMLALGLIGPVIVPGLSSVGLVVLALGAARFAKERFRAGEIAGIGLVMLAVTLFGFGGMSVDMRAVGIDSPAFLVRLGIFSLTLILLSALCYAAQKRYTQREGIVRTLNAGVLFSLSNIWLGVLTLLLTNWVRARFALNLFPYIFFASAVVATSSMFGMAETQRAFAVGEVSKLIMIQNLPAQLFPLAAYFTVFRLKPDSLLALPMTLIAIVCVLAGSILLGARQTVVPTTHETLLARNN